MSLGQLAIKSGLSKSLIKGIIDGDKRITSKSIGPIRKALGLPPLLNELFFYLVAQEVPEIFEDTTTQKTKGLIKKYAQLVLEEYVSPPKADDFFKTTYYPIIYASLGSFESGATLADIKLRSAQTDELINKGLEALVNMGAAKQEGERYYANKQFLFGASSKKGSNFYHYYLAKLEQQEVAVKGHFEDSNKLFYNNVFSVNTRDLPNLREDLLELLNRYVQKSEEPAGTQVITIQAALF